MDPCSSDVSTQDLTPDEGGPETGTEASHESEPDGRTSPAQIVRAPTRPGVAYVSAAAFALYGDHAPVGDSTERQQQLLSESLRRADQISPIAQIFTEETILRNTAPLFLGEDALSCEHSAALYFAHAKTRMPPCYLSLLRNVSTQNAAIYLDDSDVCTMLYDLHRPNDWPSTVADLEIHARPRVVQQKDPNRIDLFIVSAGSHNWGHWLTDDLPRVAAAAFLRKHAPDKIVRLVLLSFGDAIDAVRRRSIECHPELDGVEVLFLERFVAYQFETLYFATPVSYHPITKLRGAIDYVRRSYVKLDAPPTRKLYVTRPADNVRALVDTAEVEDFMRSHGYEVIECSGFTFEEQVRLFSEAKSVVGVMGAAMTNTIFSPPGTRVVHLACERWFEPYYWDLADACMHTCSYVFGPSADPLNPPHFSRFAISTAMLAKVVEA